MSLFLPVIFILFFVFALVLIGVSMVMNTVFRIWYSIKRMFSGTSPRTNSFNGGRRNNARSSGQAPNASQKIFSADEGTYVDFEEV